MSNKHSYIYKITNLTNGKTYIGRRINNNESWEQYYGSGKLITKAIHEEGKNNFSKSLIEYCSEETTQQREEYWIKYYKSLGKVEYNISLSGYANTAKGSYWPYMSDEERKVASKNLSNGIKNSKKHKAYMVRKKKNKEKERIELIKKNKDEIKTLYIDKKMNISEIANHMNLTQIVVQRSLKENNVKLRDFTKKGTKLNIKHKNNISKGVKTHYQNKGTSKLYEYICPQCGQYFPSKRSNRVYCGEKCQKDAQRKYPVPTDAQIKEMKELRNQGLSLRKIGIKYNSTHKHVSNYINDKKSEMTIN